MEVESLRSRVAQLESELKEKEKDVYTAAELGKKLLESNQELQSQLEDNTKEYSERIENLEQEKFSLQQKLEAQKATSDAVQQEFETACVQLEQKFTQQLKYSEEVSSRKIHEITKANSDLKAENEKLEVQVKTGLEKAKIQEETIEQLREDANSQSNTTMLQHELKDLEHLYADEKCHGEELRLVLVESEGNVEVLSVEVAALQDKVASLEEECQDRCRMANEWYEALKESKERNADLNCQMEALKLEMKGDGHLRKGNSLFGEVDDRRMEIERKMISLKVRYETLEKTHATTQHQLRKMKADMSALLCQYGATSADAAHTQRLQRALDQYKSENQTLLSKLHRLEKQQAEAATAQQQRKCASAFVDFGNKAEYIQFLEQELEQVKGDHNSVIKELDLKRTQLLWESNKLSEAEAKIHHTEQEMARLKKEFTKLKMRLQESTEKLNEANLQNKQLVADKDYLENQLKTRGTKKRISEPGRQNRQSSSNDRGTSLYYDSNQSVSSVDEGGTKSTNDSSLQEIKDNSLDGSKDTSLRTVVVKKEINILDDLEKEFNKQRQQEKKSEDWHSLVGVKGGRGREEPVTLNVDNRQTTVTSRRQSNVENTDETVDVSAPVQRRPVQPRVIQVNSEDKVNECPQQ